jgi:hypothetical protein
MANVTGRSPSSGRHRSSVAQTTSPRSFQAGRVGGAFSSRLRGQGVADEADRPLSFGGHVGQQALTLGRRWRHRPTALSDTPRDPPLRPALFRRVPSLR